MRKRTKKSLATNISAGSLMFAFAVTANSAAAQDVQADNGTVAQDTQADSDAAGVDIVVTGSRGLTRTVTDSPTPIDVVGEADLLRTGKTGILSALNQLIPSFNMPARAGGGTSAIIGTGGLRGLNPDQTLVLVNGKRRHKTSMINAGAALYNGSTPADLDLISTAGIDHIEVLRDGAAAKYGSDAIAGVINILLRQRVGFDVSFMGGQNLDRSDGETYQATLSYGASLGDRGFINLSVQGKKQESSNRAELVASNVRFYNLVNGQPDPREATADRLATKNYGAFPQTQINSSYNAEYDFGSVTAYAFGTFSQRKSVLNGTFRPPNNINSLPEIYPNGLRNATVIREEDYETALGLKGELSGWEWDLSSSYGRNRARLRNTKTLNASLGPTSPTEFYTGTLASSEWVNSLDLTRAFDLSGGNLQVSGGLQHRHETYTISPGDPLSYAAGTYVIPAGQPNAGSRPAPGAQGTPGIQPGDSGSVSRSSFAAYLDVAYDPTKDLNIGIAGRFEHFDDSSGDTFNIQTTGRYAITPWLAVRGSAGTGFRAPTLAQQSYASTSNQFRIQGNAINILSVKTLPVSSPVAIALGAKPLTPEKSTSLSAGFVLEPTSNLNVTVDAYQVEIRNRITITSLLSGNAVSAILVAASQSPDINAQYYTNGMDTRTRGVDVVGTYRVDLGDLGDLRLNLGFNYNKTVITKVAPTPQELSSLGSSYRLFDRISLGNMTTLAPKTKTFFGGNWSLSKVSLNARLVRYGSYTVPQLAATADQHFGGKWITDAEVGYDVSEHLNLAIGANNLFNVYPDRAGVFNTSLGFQQYGTAPASPFGFTGGYYYARAVVTF